MFRALIVEDEDLMREYLAAKLHDLCPEWETAATAADGMEAVEKLAHERFDAVLTDIRMPGMDGLELARYIRHTDAQLPILILSGYDEFDYARAAVRLNVFDYLLKPLNEAELSAALSAMAAQAAARASSEYAGILAAALEGDNEACGKLAERLGGKPCGLLLIAPALVAESDIYPILLEQMQTYAEASYSPLCARLPQGAAVLCPAADPLLVETECRNVAQHFVKTHPELHLCCGYARFDLERIRLCKAGAASALRLAQALHEPLLAEHPLYEQRQAQACLDVMLGDLNNALASATLADERRASLLAALAQFSPNARNSAALSLLYECDAEETLRTQALQAMQLCGDTEKDDVQARFSLALDRLFYTREESAKPASVLVQQARDYLLLHFAEPVSLAALADQLSITSAYLSSLFHREMGLSYSQYLLQLRMEDAARRLLSDPSAKIYDIGQAVGFPSAKHFTHVFGQFFHLSPKEYRENRGRR